MLRPSRDWRESITLSSRDPHFGQRIVSEHSVSHNKLWRQCARSTFLRFASKEGTRPRPYPLQPEERAFLRSGRFGGGNFLFGLCLFFFELETGLSVFQFQVSRKGASFFGNKFVQEIGFSCRNEFLHLFFWNLAMQDVFTDAKGTCLGRCDGIFASARTI